MVKAKVIEKFDLKDFNSLINLKRADKSKDKKGCLYLNDTFECDEKMADYLTGNNPLSKKVVEIIEVKKIEKEENDVKDEKVIIKKSKKSKK